MAAVGMVRDSGAMSADETLFRLALADWEPLRVDGWWEAGVRDPVVARTLADRMTSLAARQWINAGIPPEHITRHQRVATVRYANALTAHGIVDPVAQRRFIRTRLTDAQFHHYRSMGIDSIDDMVVFAAAGYSAQQVCAYADGRRAKVRELAARLAEGLTDHPAAT